MDARYSAIIGLSTTSRRTSPRKRNGARLRSRSDNQLTCHSTGRQATALSLNISKQVMGSWTVWQNMISLHLNCFCAFLRSEFLFLFIYFAILLQNMSKDYYSQTEWLRLEDDSSMMNDEVLPLVHCTCIHLENSNPYLQCWQLRESLSQCLCVHNIPPL